MRINKSRRKKKHRMRNSSDPRRDCYLKHESELWGINLLCRRLPTRTEAADIPFIGSLPYEDDAALGLHFPFHPREKSLPRPRRNGLHKLSPRPRPPPPSRFLESNGGVRCFETSRKEILLGRVLWENQEVSDVGVESFPLQYGIQGLDVVASSPIISVFCRSTN